MREIVKDPWDYDFLMRIKKAFNLIELVMATNYLDIGGLMELLFAYIASKYKGKDFNKIKQKHGIKEDFTEEEEEKILIENPWASK
jgi:S-phase kinase-associated protein 1